MPQLDLAVEERLPGRGDQFEQLEALVDVDDALADPVGDRRRVELELVDQRLVAVRLLDGMEVLALEVADHEDLERLLVGERSDDDRQLRDPGELGRAGPAGAVEDLVAGLVLRSHQEGRQDSLFLHGVGEVLEGLRVEVEARIVGRLDQELGVDERKTAVSDACHTILLGVKDTSAEHHWAAGGEPAALRCSGVQPERWWTRAELNRRPSGVPLGRLRS